MSREGQGKLGRKPQKVASIRECRRGGLELAPLEALSLPWGAYKTNLFVVAIFSEQISQRLEEIKARGLRCGHKAESLRDVVFLLSVRYS